MRREFETVVAALVSMMIHGGLMTWLAGIAPARAEEAPAPRAHDVASETQGPTGVATPGADLTRAREIPIELGAPARAENLSRAPGGRGGDGSAPPDAALLVSRVDDVRLQDAPWNALGVAQVQRIHTGDARASWDDRRATPNPNDQPFLASGAGRLPERRPLAETEPRAGAPRAPAHSAVGQPLEPAATVDALESASGRGAERAESASRARPERRPGSAAPSPGVGLARSEGAHESRAAQVATGRPAVDEGPAATLAPQRERPRDDTDSELLATRLMQSWVDASPRRGASNAPGGGGAGGGGAPSSGGSSGEGGQASAHAPGEGQLGALDTRDERYRAWLLTQRRRVRDALVFPRERQLRMDQGVVVYTFAVDARGQLVGSPRLARSSGFADLDAAALRAIRDTLPTAPPPNELMRGRTAFPVRMHLDFSNPMVR